jgi:bis(5'-nucleosidyl)-tetraphosphatase
VRSLLAGSCCLVYKQDVKFERSAGVVVYRNLEDGGRVFLLLDYGSHWDYPKGHVEEGEDDLSAARRELREETGIDSVALHDDFAHEIEYFFRSRRGGMIKKTVVFFLGKTETEAVTLSDEHVAYEWLDETAALKRLSYANAKAVLRKACDRLNQRA